jgi:hypothetical protein
MEEQPSAATSGPAAAAAAAGSAAAAAAAAPAATPDIYDLFRNSSAFPGDFDTLDMDAQNEMYSAYLSFIEQDGGGGGGGGSEGAMTGTTAASDHGVYTTDGVAITTGGIAAKTYHWRNIPPVVDHLITTDGIANYHWRNGKFRQIPTYVRISICLNLKAGCLE